MIVFECSNLTSEGRCHHYAKHVLVFGRQAPVDEGVMTVDVFADDDVMQVFNAAVRKACVEPGDVIQVFKRNRK